MRNLDRLSESGLTRREWKRYCKDHDRATNLAIKATNTGYEIAFRAAKRGESWMEVFKCLRICNLNPRGRAMLPRLP